MDVSLFKISLPLPAAVSAVVSSQQLTFVGPLGVHTYSLPTLFTAQLVGRILYVSVNGEVVTCRQRRSIFALVSAFRSLLRQWMWGVAGGFVLELALHGRGWRAAVKGEYLYLRTNYSHVMRYPVPLSVEVSISESQKVVCYGSHLGLLTRWAGQLCLAFPRDSYVGKGIALVGRPYALKPSVKAKSK